MNTGSKDAQLASIRHIATLASTPSHISIPFRPPLAHVRSRAITLVSPVTTTSMMSVLHVMLTALSFPIRLVSAILTTHLKTLTIITNALLVKILLRVVMTVLPPPFAMYVMRPQGSTSMR